MKILSQDMMKGKFWICVLRPDSGLNYISVHHEHRNIVKNITPMIKFLTSLDVMNGIVHIVKVSFSYRLCFAQYMSEWSPHGARDNTAPLHRRFFNASDKKQFYGDSWIRHH